MHADPTYPRPIKRIMFADKELAHDSKQLLAWMTVAATLCNGSSSPGLCC